MIDCQRYGNRQRDYQPALGVAVFPEHGDTTWDILVATDNALYQAKRDGRNRVVVSDRK